MLDFKKSLNSGSWSTWLDERQKQQFIKALAFSQCAFMGLFILLGIVGFFAPYQLLMHIGFGGILFGILTTIMNWGLLLSGAK